MNSVKSNNTSLKYYMVTSSGFKDIGIGRLEIVAKKTFWKKLLIREILQDAEDC